MSTSEFTDITDYVLNQILPYQGVNEIVHNTFRLRDAFDAEHVWDETSNTNLGRHKIRLSKQATVFNQYAGDGTDGPYEPAGPTANLDLSTPKQYTSINIAVGVTVTITGAVNGVASIGCQGDCTIAGAIVVNALGPAGGAGFIDNPATRLNYGGAGGDGTGSPGILCAQGGGGGGSSAYNSGSSGYDGGDGGIGGWYLYGHAYDNHGVGYVSATTQDGPGGAGGAGRAATVLLATIPHVAAGPGGGGGGGASGATDANNDAADGGNGGTGGTLLIIEVGGTLTFTGSITANGGTGSNGQATDGNIQYAGGGGGGGGGGGCVFLVANAVASQTGTITTNGGAGGTGTAVTGDMDGGAGGAGGAGYYDIIELYAA